MPEFQSPLSFQMLKTEKGTMLATSGQYMFKFPPSATKGEARKAIAQAYSVHPVEIRMMNVSGKHVRYGRSLGKTKNWKKAIVKLKQGEKIEVK